MHDVIGLDNKDNWYCHVWRKSFRRRASLFVCLFVLVLIPNFEDEIFLRKGGCENPAFIKGRIGVSNPLVKGRVVITGLKKLIKFKKPN